MREFIKKISDNFVQESLMSPQLLADMAMMEKYMTESYNGRVFIELLQNADDSGAKRIHVSEKNGNLFFANDGKPFDEADIMSISRSGASKKKDGDYIGYRGVGFKSSTSISSEIIISSLDSCFTFSKSICANVLKKNENEIPTVRIPFVVNELDEDVTNKIDELKSEGYTTVFIFKDAKLDIFFEELKEVNSGLFIFLRNIEEYTSDIFGEFNRHSIVREKVKNMTVIKQDDNDDSKWLIVGDDNLQIGFKFDGERIVSCSENEAVYHSFLPTLDKVSFPFKVNGCFSTDPSRKHVTYDEITTEIIKKISKIIYKIVDETVNGKNTDLFSEIFNILTKSSAFSKINTLLKSELKEAFLSNKFLLLNSGEIISASEYLLLPDWLEGSEQKFIRSHSKKISANSAIVGLYEKTTGFDNFIQAYTNSIYENKDFIEMLEEKEFVEQLNEQTYGKILGRIVKKSKNDEMLYDKKYNLSNVKIPTTSGVVDVSELGRNDVLLNSSLVESTLMSSTKSDNKWFCEKLGIDEGKFHNEMETEVNNTLVNSGASLLKINSDKIFTTKFQISKWRSAEQQCIEIEQSFGNSAIDVSKKNVGYDVESTTPDGVKKCIEVKLLKNEGGSFSITNNEYTCAHQLGDQFYLYLIIQDEHKFNLVIIQNPLEKLSFEKRIRQWEWYCEEYTGDEFVFDY